jgi:tRNA A37 threonylcarbamoyltransferase TsaD
MARAVEDAIVDTLTGGPLRALEVTGPQTLVVWRRGARTARHTVDGGRGRAGRACTIRAQSSTDNAAMIAVAAGGWRGEHDSLAIGARARRPLESLRLVSQAPPWP